MLRVDSTLSDRRRYDFRIARVEVLENVCLDYLLILKMVLRWTFNVLSTFFQGVIHILNFNIKFVFFIIIIF